MEEQWYKVKRLFSKFSHFQKRKRYNRYGLPILLVIIVFFVKIYLYPILGDASVFLMVSFIVVVSSWYGGLGPGLFATVITAILTFFVFLGRDPFHHTFLGNLILTLLFITEGTIISIASEARFEMEEQKDEFIALLAHELKNPLSAVYGFSELIIKKSNDKLPKIKWYAESIINSSNKMLELINDLLDLSRIEIGSFVYTDSFFDILDLVKEIVGHQKIIEKDRIIEFKGDSKKYIYADRYRIGQVITNLITNALKYSPQDRKVVVKITNKRGSILISVKDFGFGIPKNEQKKVFSKLYRIDKLQSKSQGLGLGLYICRRIVDHYKGKLWVKSRTGKGSIFFLQLLVGK